LINYVELLDVIDSLALGRPNRSFRLALDEPCGGKARIDLSPSLLIAKGMRVGES